MAAIALLSQGARAQEKEAAKEEIERIPVPDFSGEDLPETDPDPGLEFSRIKGVNYIPAYAASPYHMWANYDPAKIQLDLARARKIGFNSVRVFLSYLAYEEKPSAFLENFRDFIEACQGEGMTVMPVLFDSWGIDHDRVSPLMAAIGEGDAGDSKRETIKTAYERFLQRPEAYRLNEDAFRRQLRVLAEGALSARLVPLSNDPSAAFWGDWPASPGHSRMGKKNWLPCEDYMKEVMTPYLESPFIVAWDIMNQPDTIRVFSKEVDTMPAHEFAIEMLGAARALGPKRPLTLGAGVGWSGTRAFSKKVGVVSLHVIQEPASQMAAAVKEARRNGLPVMITLAGATMFPANEDEITDEAQRELVRRTLLQIRRERAGFYLWHLVEGESITPWAGLMRKDGSLKPAALWLRKELAN